MNRTIKLSVHPDALYDSLYQEKTLNLDDYEKLTLAYKGEYRYENGVVVLTTSGYCFVIENCYDNTLRLRIIKAGSVVDKTVTERLGLVCTEWGARTYHYEYSENKIKFSNKCMCFTYDFDTNEYEFRDKDGYSFIRTSGGGIHVCKNGVEYSGFGTLTTFFCEKEERFSGFGARMHKINRRGCSADIFAQKGGTKEGDYGGFPVPYFISSRGYGVFVNNPWPHVYFDMAKSKDDEWFLYTPGGDYDIFVFFGNSAAPIIQSFTAITGRNQMPDKWIMGYWCSSIRFDEAESVVQEMLRMRAEGYPTDAVVIDGPWRGGKNFIKDYSVGWGYPSDDYNWHNDFGDGPGMIQELNKQNIKTVLHINSCAFKQETAVPAIAQGFLRQIGSETIPDVVSKKGIDYYKSFLVPRIKDGVCQWWTDHSDRVSGEVCSGIPSRNLFGALWNKVISEVMAENGVKNHMALSRGGGIGSQRYALPWAGDTEFGVHRFKDDIWYVLNAGMAGFSLCGYDLGGFMRKNKMEGNADEQQFEMDNICRRMCQSMIFVPMPRMHNGDSAKPKWPWNCPKETRALYRECLRFRYRFIPNLYSYAIHASKTGEPILRPLFYKDLKNGRLYDYSEEFYLGEDLLLAPVTEAGITEKQVYLPEGEWIHLWTKTWYEGEREILCEAPLLQKEGLPMFVRCGGGLAYQKNCEYLSNDIPEELEIELYGKKQAELKLYESAQTTNVFSFHIEQNHIYIEAENNTSVERTYKIRLFTAQGHWEVDGRVEAMSTYKWII